MTDGQRPDTKLKWIGAILAAGPLYFIGAWLYITHYALFTILVYIGIGLALTFCCLWQAKRYGIPCLHQLAEAYEKFIHARGQHRRNAILTSGDYGAVIDTDSAPYARAEFAKNWHINQTIESTAYNTQRLLPAPTPQPLLARDLMDDLLKLAQENLRHDLHDEKRWLIGQAVASGELVMSEFMNEFCNTMICGQPRKGKTTAMLWLILNVIASGGKIMVLDPHASHKRRGLLHKLSALEEYFFVPPHFHMTEETVYRQFKELQRIYEQREATGAETPLLLVICDEYAELLDKIRDKHKHREVETIIANVIKGGNKFGMLMLLANHNWQVEYIGGSKIRDNITGAISFLTSDNQYVMVLGIKDHQGVTLPPLTAGEAVVKRTGYELERVRFPLTTEEDIATFIASMRLLRTSQPNYRTTTPNYQPNYCNTDRDSGSSTAYQTASPIWTPPQRHSPTSLYNEAKPPYNHHSLADTSNTRQHVTAPLYEYTAAQQPPYDTPSTDEPTTDELPNYPPEEKEKGICTGKVRPELPNFPKRTPRKLSDKKKARIQLEAEMLMREYKHVPRKMLQERSGVSADEYADFKAFCAAMGYPRNIPKDISDAEWEALKAAYDYRCLDCGRQEPDVTLEKDHVLSRDLGGKHSVSNIQPLCRACNNRKQQRIIDYRKDTFNVSN